MTIEIDKPTARRRRSHLRYNKTKIPGLRSGEGTPRKCMCCAKTFNSEHKFNRLCCYCKETMGCTMA